MKKINSHMFWIEKLGNQKVMYFVSTRMKTKIKDDSFNIDIETTYKSNGIV